LPEAVAFLRWINFLDTPSSASVPRNQSLGAPPPPPLELLEPEELEDELLLELEELELLEEELLDELV
jgi:hypothetical protein